MKNQLPKIILAHCLLVGALFFTTGCDEQVRAEMRETLVQEGKEIGVQAAVALPIANNPEYAEVAEAIADMLTDPANEDKTRDQIRELVRAEVLALTEDEAERIALSLLVDKVGDLSRKLFRIDMLPEERAEARALLAESIRNGVAYGLLINAAREG